MVGWCKWVPTFPRAGYLFSKLEWEDIQQPSHPEDEAIVRDCVRPIFDAGLVEFVGSDHRLTEEVCFEAPRATPRATSASTSLRAARRP